MDLLAYTQPVVVSGERRRVELKASTPAARLHGWLVRLAPAPSAAMPAPPERTFEVPGRVQPFDAGSCLLVELPRPLPPPSAGASSPPGAGSGEGTLQLWLRPQGSNGADGCVASIAGPGGAVELWLGVGGTLSWRRVAASGADAPGSGERGAVGGGDAARADRATAAAAVAETGTIPLTPGVWCFVAAAWSEHENLLELWCCRANEPLPAQPAQAATAPGAATPFSPARLSIAASVAGGAPCGFFNGRVDSPRLWSRRLRRDELLALLAGAPASSLADLACEWRFVDAAPAGLSATVPDAGPLQAHGRLRNLPTVAVTGASWDGVASSHLESPSQYNAAHFHDDDLADCEWATDAALEVPPEWPSGVYAFRLAAGEERDEVPFVVSATGRVVPGTRAPVVVLLPTLSWLAYANEHASWQNPIPSSEGMALVVSDADRYVAEHRLLSIYDRHSDGTGACYSSWRRPVLNLRDGYEFPLVRGPHQFSADLELLRFLDASGIAYDVITDDDLHRAGAGALLGYAVVVTGSHPEYWTWPMMSGIDRYLGSGGRMAYLGGNGFYWVTSVPPGSTEVLEVRRGRSGTRVWESEPGEEHQWFTGERGGLWRNRGWAPQRLSGVGFTAQGFDRALPYEWLIDSSHPVAGFICAGVDTGAPLDAPGSVLGGAAGFEIDRVDAAQGTPPETVVVARATGFSDAYQGVVEDILTADSRQGGTASPLVRADLTFTVLASGGAVFSVGSISWCGALAAGGGDNPVAQVTRNVIGRLASPEPFAVR
jgi:N,N-dimethylformamidase